MSTVATFDNKEVMKLLNKIINKTNDIQKKDKKVIGLLSAVVFKDVMDHFQKEQGRSGKWPKWSETYKMVLAGVAHFRRINGRTIMIKGPDPLRTTRPPTKKLQDTGRLRNSFLPTNYRIDREGVTWYNPAKTMRGFPYAKAHDEGGGKLPQREFMWISARATGEFEDLIIKYLES